MKSPVGAAVVAAFFVVSGIYFVAPPLAQNLGADPVDIALMLVPMLFVVVGASARVIAADQSRLIFPHPALTVAILVLSMIGLRYLIGFHPDIKTVDPFHLFPVSEFALIAAGSGLMVGFSKLFREHLDVRRKIGTYREQNVRYERIIQEREANVEMSRSRSEQEMIRMSSQLVQVKDFARKIGAASDENEIFRIIHDSAVMILDVEKSAFLSVTETESGQVELKAVGSPRGWSDDEIAHSIIKRPHPYEQVIRERRIYVRIRGRDSGATTMLAAADPLQASYIQPIVHGHRLFGMLILSEPKKADARQASAIFSIFGDLGGIALENAAIVHRIREQAVKDGLTGLHNHRFFQDYLSRSLETDPVVSVILTDIDHFKKFNDTYGHQTGDAVLRLVARLARDVIENEVGAIPGDALLARYGGEEFVIVLPGRSVSAAAEIAESVREKLASSILEHEGETHRITLSLGVACGSAMEEKNELIRRADEALYRSKQAGRNRVSVDRPVVSESAQVAA